MKYSDLSQYKDLATSKLQYFFHNIKIAQIGLLATVSILALQLYLLFSLSLDAKNWQMPQISYSNINFNLSPHKKTLEISDIKEKHLFGEVIRDNDSLDDALKSILPLTLKGVIASSDPKDGQAIIQDAAGKEDVYFIDDRIPVDSGLVTLEYVYKDKIYIKNNGVLEYILYPVLDLSSLQGNDDANANTSSKAQRKYVNPLNGNGRKMRSFRQVTPNTTNPTNTFSKPNRPERAAVGTRSRSMGSSISAAPVPDASDNTESVVIPPEVEDADEVEEPVSLNRRLYGKVKKLNIN